LYKVAVEYFSDDYKGKRYLEKLQKIFGGETGEEYDEEEV